LTWQEETCGADATLNADEGKGKRFLCGGRLMYRSFVRESHRRSAQVQHALTRDHTALPADRQRETHLYYLAMMLLMLAERGASLMTHNA